MNYLKRLCLLVIFISFTACEFDRKRVPAISDIETSIEVESQNIASGQNIRNIWWSPDSKTIYWLWGAYNLDEGIVQDLTEEDILSQTPQPKILEQLPQYYRAYPSPSGNQVIYISLKDAPLIPTFDPEIEGGEALNACGTSEVLFWTAFETYSLGQIEQCGPNDYLWTSDEQKMMLIQNEQLPPWKAWLIDAPQKNIYPIESNDSGLLQIHGISPDDQFLLYGFYLDNTGEEKLVLLDLEDLAITPLETKVHSVGDWLNSKTILVQCYGGDLSAEHPLGVLDLTTFHCSKLMDSSTTDKVVGYMSVSPDKQWVAFTTGKTIHTQENVLLMNLKLTVKSRLDGELDNN